MASLLAESKVTLDTIKPLHKTPHVDIIGVTACDMISPDGYVPTLFSYRLADNSDEKYTQFLSGLKESLQKVLVLYFPFAGRYVQTNEGRGRQLICNDEGVPFIESVVDVDLDSVVPPSGKFKPVPALNGYETMGLNPCEFRQEPPPMPAGRTPIFIKLTRFSCGGVTLGLTFSHMLTDGESFYDFLTAWSDISRTGTAPKFRPDFNREQAKTYEESLKRIPSDSPLQMFSKMLTEIQPCPPAESREVWVSRTFEVRAAVVNSWKKNAVLDSDGGYVSTGDCIMAHLWQSVAKLPPALIGDKEILINNVAEGRGRFYETPLPRLLGNVYSIISGPQLSMEQIRNELPHKLGHKLREHLLERIDQGDWFSLDAIAQLLEASTGGKSLTCIFSSWVKFPSYEMDFGCGGGKPVFAAGVNAGYTLPGLAFILINAPIPGHSDSAATLNIMIAPKLMDALTSSQEFLSFFLP